MIVGPCSSAMDVAVHLHGNKILGPGGAVLAVSQRAGRGRMGRSWASPAGNLYAARIRPTGPARDDRLLPLRICGAVVRALENVGLPARIKWPNDVLADGRKIGGILTEEKGNVMLAGIGVNLASAPNPRLLTMEGALPAACLEDFGIETDPLGVWLAIVDMCERMTSLTPEALIAEAEKRLAWLGRTVTIISDEFPGGAAKAAIAGIGDDGRLKIEYRGRIKYLTSYERLIPH